MGAVSKELLYEWISRSKAVNDSDNRLTRDIVRSLSCMRCPLFLGECDGSWDKGEAGCLEALKEFYKNYNYKEEREKKVKSRAELYEKIRKAKAISDADVVLRDNVKVECSDCPLADTCKQEKPLGCLDRLNEFYTKYECSDAECNRPKIEIVSASYVRVSTLRRGECFIAEGFENAYMVLKYDYKERVVEAVNLGTGEVTKVVSDRYVIPAQVNITVNRKVEGD